jgi:hypothetical protein
MAATDRKETYTFTFTNTRCGTERQCTVGTLPVRVTDDITIHVHFDTLHNASGAYRRLVQDGMAPEACYDIRASALALWQVDFFLCLAYDTPWVWEEDEMPENVSRLKDVTATLGFFDASKRVYRAADDPGALVPYLKNGDPAPSVVVEALLAVDHVGRTLLRDTYSECVYAMHVVVCSTGEEPGGADGTRREDLKRLSQDALIDVLYCTSMHFGGYKSLVHKVLKT